MKWKIRFRTLFPLEHKFRGFPHSQVVAVEDGVVGVAVVVPAAVEVAVVVVFHVSDSP